MKKLTDYILHLDNWIPKNICKKTIEEISQYKTWKRHTYTNALTYKHTIKNGDKELDICYGDNLTYYDDLLNLTWKALEKYIVIDNKGENHFNSWNGFTALRFNRYNKNQIMDKHCDHIHSLFEGNKRGIPILSIVSVLNDDFQGGEFIMFDDYEIKFKSGDLIIFPSVFLYPHLVKAVKKGIRSSFVSWAY